MFAAQPSSSAGHDGGDHARVEFARHAEKLSPGPALTARLGGDEFALIFPGIGSAEAVALARGLNRVAVHSSTDGGVGNPLSVSVGIVLFHDLAGGADSLLADGEIALAQARAKGHGSWHLHAGGGS